jgi:hypothetical protein
MFNNKLCSYDNGDDYDLVKCSPIENVVGLNLFFIILQKLNRNLKWMKMVNIYNSIKKSIKCIFMIYKVFFEKKKGPKQLDIWFF